VLEPQIDISGQTLVLLHESPPPAITLECQGISGCPFGDVIRIDGPAGRSVYVVTDEVSYVPPVFRARWPD
jgi:hypothetical protein